MSTLYISEFAGVAQSQIGGEHINFPKAPPVVEQTVAIGGTSTQSNAFNAQTTLIRVSSDAICSISIGISPTATTTTARLPANGVEYFGVTAGQKIAVVSNT